MSRPPPRWIEAFLRGALPRSVDGSALSGDLHELFEDIQNSVGFGKARQWYIRQVVSTLLWLWVEDAGMRIQGFREELWLATRGFLRTRGFSALAVSTLAAGIGSICVVFGVVQSVLLAPLAYPDAGRLVSVMYSAPGLGFPTIPSSKGTHQIARESAVSLEETGLYSTIQQALTGRGDATQIVVAAATPSVFSVLGTNAIHGRFFTEKEGLPNGPPVAVVSHTLWESSFGSDPAVVGQTITLDGVVHQIVGVGPQRMEYPFRRTAAWIPLTVDPGASRHQGFNFNGLARLRVGAGMPEAASELRSLLPRVAERYEDVTPEFLEQAKLDVVVRPLADALVGSVRSRLWILMATAGLVLLIAGMNSVNLLLVRMVGRTGEFSLRRALGAQDSRVFAQLVSEAFILSLAGGVLGLGLGWGGLWLVRAKAVLPRAYDVEMTPRVVGFVLGVSVLMALVCTALTLLVERGGSRGGRRLRLNVRGVKGASGHRVRKALVAGQVAVALVLLIGSGLMVRSFQALSHVDAGFNAEDVVVATVSLPWSRYESAEAVSEFHRRLIDRLSAIPGVTAVGASSRLPLAGLFAIEGLVPEHSMADDSDLPPTLESRAATQGYFKALEIPLLEGRLMSNTEAALSVVISRTAADLYWPGQSAIGKRLGYERTGDIWYSVIGIVGDVRNVSLTNPPVGTVYFPAHSLGANQRWLAQTMAFTVRTALPLSTVGEPVRAALAELDPEVPISGLGTLSGRIKGARAQAAFTTGVLMASALVGLFLGAVGLYGVISFVTSQSTQEFGLRMALGAQQSRIRALVLKEGAGLLAMGVMSGLIAAAFLTRLLRAALYEVSAADPMTFVAVTLLLVGVSFIAMWIPARRAAAVDPAVALRSE